MKTLSLEHRRKLSETARKQKRIPPSRLGSRHTEEYKRHYSEIRRGENSTVWKGNNIGYEGVHSWIELKFGRPKRCENCGTTTAKRYEWASISGKHKRELTDWIRLCKKCHVKLDDSTNKGWQTRRLYV